MSRMKTSKELNFATQNPGMTGAPEEMNPGTGGTSLRGGSRPVGNFYTIAGPFLGQNGFLHNALNCNLL